LSASGLDQNHGNPVAGDRRRIIAGLRAKIFVRPQIPNRSRNASRITNICPLSSEAIQAYLHPLFGAEERAQLFESLLRTCFLAPECHSAFVLAGLRTVRTPTLVVWGTADIFFDVKWAEWLRKTIPGTREVVMLEGAKLFFPEERPDELARALLRFWA
jgi:pimeloyl-ACP methyl ester carboxylesterase